MKSRMAVVMIAVGVAVGIVGLIVMNVAAGRKEHAEGVYGFSKALAGKYASTSAIDAAVSMGHLGLGILIAGGAIALAGVMVVAIRRP